MILLIMLPIASLLLLSALLIRFKKTYWMISGYNTMSEEEKRNVDAEKMGKSTSNSILVMSALVFIGGLFLYYNKDILGIISLMLILPVSLITVAVSQKYDNNYKGKEKKQNIIFTVAGFGIFFTLVIVLVFVSLSTGSKMPSYAIKDETFTISGMSGESINLSDINSVELKSTLPGKIEKKSGFNFNKILKGRFTSDIGDIKLFVDTSKAPFLYIKTGDEIIILNGKTNLETKKLYEELKASKR